MDFRLGIVSDTITHIGVSEGENFGLTACRATMEGTKIGLTRRINGSASSYDHSEGEPTITGRKVASLF